MAPKPAKKDDKKAQVDPVEAKYQEEIKQLEKARQDLQLEQAFVSDKFRQLRAENERLKAEVEGYKSRLGHATEDYADILEHRQEQIKVEELKISDLQQMYERMQAEIGKYQGEIDALKKQLAVQAAKLEDAAQMLKDKDTLEEAVRKQHDLIERQNEELKTLKKNLDERGGQLDKANLQIEELTLRNGGATELRILFDEAWLVQVSYARLKGDIPVDRELTTISMAAMGKYMVMYGGVSRTASTPDAVGKELAVLNLETSLWERPASGRTLHPCYAHCASVVGRSKVMVFGGQRTEGTVADVSLFNTDTMKWFIPQLKGTEKPLARTGHACCSSRDRVFVFGGVTAEGILLNDVWMFELEASQWSHVNTFGATPTPRRGSSLACAEDGRRLYVFGGNDGTRPLGDVHVLDLEKLAWSPIQVHIGTPPEPREDAVSTVVSKYLVISGGCGLNGTKQLGDTRLLDVFSPRWEVLDEGAWTQGLPWLKAHGAYTAFYANKQYIIKPNVHEKLWELQTVEWLLPEDIERMRSAKKKDNTFTEKLELMDDAVCGVSFLELSWRSPTKNADRIDRYKLMIATSTGVVKDVYQGRATRFRVTGLKSNTEYILCVKAIYEDGSFLWSESKAYHTLA